MTKGTKTGIVIGVVVALGVASYFLFFKNKGEDKPKNNKSDSDSDSDEKDFRQTVGISNMANIVKMPSDGTKHYIGLATGRQSKGTFEKGDIAVISNTTDKLNGEYVIEGISTDTNGNINAITLDIIKNYKPVYDSDGKDETFNGFGKIIIQKELKSDIGGCGCGA